MANKKTTNTATNDITAATENVAADSIDTVKKNTNKNVSKESETKVESESKKSKVDVSTLNDTDEIEIISLVPHVSYKDKRTEDLYSWEDTGHTEYMNFETVKDMWRNNKGYFRKLWLKPLDDRVLEKFGLTKLYSNYEYLMDSHNYRKDNADKLVTTIKETPVDVRFTISNKIKELVETGHITDAYVLKKLGTALDVDFIAFL